MAHHGSLRVALVSALLGLACGGGASGGADGGGEDDAPGASADGPGDGPVTDATGPDAIPRTYSCGAFAEPAGWTVTEGYRAVVVADDADGLSLPVAIAFAGGALGGDLFVVNAGSATVSRVDVDTGTVTPFAATWPVAPGLFTTITWDRDGAFGGDLFVGDQGGDGDGDSRIFRVDPTGAAVPFAAAPGPGLDDVYALTFSPGGAYPAGLLVTGDTDGAGVDWGVVDALGASTSFSEVAGTEGAAFDRAGTFGGGLFASRPAGGGYAGDDTISRIDATGALGVPLASGRAGIHALTFAPAGGAFGGRALAASWSTQDVTAIDPTGAIEVLASGLALTNYDGNILDASPDGRVLLVADRAANRLVCIEPVTP